VDAAGTSYYDSKNGPKKQNPIKSMPVI